MAMVAQRQRSGKRAFQRLEAPEMGKPLLIGQVVESHAPRPALVTVAQNGLGEIGGLDAIEERIAQGFVIAGRFETDHGALTPTQARQFAHATQPIPVLASSRGQIDLYRFP